MKLRVRAFHRAVPNSRDTRGWTQGLWISLCPLYPISAQGPGYGVASLAPNGIYIFFKMIISFLQFYLFLMAKYMLMENNEKCIRSEKKNMSESPNV